jgi:ABC-type multidrug transport system fused ATPase/permease subunit
MNSVKRWKANSTLVASFRLFSKEDRLKIMGSLFVQIIIGTLDLLGIALIGILGALAITGIQSGSPGGRVSQLLNFLRIDSLTFQQQTCVIAVLAVCILVFRTLVSIILTRMTLRFIARKAASLSSNLVGNILAQSIEKIQSYSIQTIMYSVSNGVTAITLGIVAGSISLIADLALVSIMTTGLFLIDFQIAIFAIMFFSSIGFLLYKLQQKQARALGKKEAELNVSSNQRIYESIVAFREISTKGVVGNYVKEIRDIRFQLADTLAQISFLPNISKYVIEASIIIGALLVSAFQFLNYDAKHAVATLAVFVAAASRISPAILRAQQGLISIKNSLGGAETTLKIIEDIGLHGTSGFSTQLPIFSHKDFQGDLKSKDVTFQYSGNSSFMLSKIDLEISKGEFIALVGTSGSGKSTLADIFMGVLPNFDGKILISGMNPSDTVRRYAGAIAYVPQTVEVFPGSIISNIALGYSIDTVDMEQIKRAVALAKLDEYIETLSDGLETVLGDRGVKLSGGQRQRLGIARALYTNPKLIVFDEATSSLDGITEQDITDSLMALKGDVTIIMIAHRLSSIRKADKVVYIESGRILATGTFEEVRSSVPNFELQALAMGL